MTMTGVQPTRRELDVWWLTYEEARDAARISAGGSTNIRTRLAHPGTLPACGSDPSGIGRSVGYEVDITFAACVWL